MSSRWALAAAGALLVCAPLTLGAARQGPGAAAADPNEWRIDSAHSSADFAVTHLVVSTVRGHLGPVSGKVWYDGVNVSSIRAEASIDVKALSTGSDSRDNDLRGEEFFNVPRYPAITFKSTRVAADGPGKFSLTGDLTIRDTTKEVTLKVDGPSAILKAQGMSRVAAEATTTINRFDYGLKYNRLIEGTAVVGPDVKITINLEIIKR